MKLKWYISVNRVRDAEEKKKRMQPFRTEVSPTWVRIPRPGKVSEIINEIQTVFVLNLPLRTKIR